MVRLIVEIDDRDAELLRERAARANGSIEEQVREAVRAYLGEVLTLPASNKPPRPLSEIRTFSPLPAEERNDLKDHDRWWAEAILASKRPG